MRDALLVLPTFNEALNLPRLVARIRELDVPVEILVVDDASPDGTGEQAEELAKRDAGLHVLHRRGRRGYGPALVAGFAAALEQDVSAVLTMDSDWSHDPADLPRLLAALADAEVVVGSRYTRGGRVADWPWHRRALSAAANAFVRLLFHLPARDCTSGFRAYRREALVGVPWDRLHSTGYSFLVELLHWTTRASGRRVCEVPIWFVDRKHGKSKMGLRQVFVGASDLLKLRAQMFAGRASAPTRGPLRDT
jgi:glycosyltransferase involved in cell wall biosynthesis